jgi:hypothetical protein
MYKNEDKYSCTREVITHKNYSERIGKRKQGTVDEIRKSITG